MQTRIIDSLKAALLIVVLILGLKLNISLPWWGFVIPLFALGFVIRVRKWQVTAFPLGFVTGFLIWWLGNLYFDLTLNGRVLEKLALLLSIHKTVLLLGTGVMGGLVTGLSLYIGKNMILYRQGVNAPSAN